jgi:hypothetical protein
MRYWNGLGQTTQSILAAGPSAALATFTPPTNWTSSAQLPDGGTIHYFPPDGRAFEVYGADGTYYYQDSTGYWFTTDARGKCWGDALGGGWYCDDGSSGGNWYTAPRVSATKQKAQAAKASAPPPTTTTPAAPGPLTTPAQAPSTPPPAKDPNDVIVSQQGPDAAGGIVYFYASNASYYVLPDGTWTYTDADGNSYSGDARGNYCDSLGNCVGPDWGPSSDNTWIYIAGGALVVLLIIMGGRRR